MDSGKSSPHFLFLSPDNGTPDFPQLKQETPASTAWSAESRQSNDFWECSPTGGRQHSPTSREDSDIPGGPLPEAAPPLIRSRWPITTKGRPRRSGTNGPIRAIPSPRRGTSFHEQQRSELHIGPRPGAMLECSRTLFKHALEPTPLVAWSRRMSSGETAENRPHS